MLIIHTLQHGIYVTIVDHQTIMDTAWNIREIGPPRIKTQDRHNIVIMCQSIVECQLDDIRVILL